MTKILVSNDDGVYAPGLKALYEAMCKVGETRVFAPDRNRSGVSNSLTLHRPLTVKQLQNGFYSVEGTPTDCVHLALTGLLDFEPDIVVSGVNAGANLGDDVLYSGTVAAAREGRFMELPAIAISLAGDFGKDYEHYETGAEIARMVVKQMAENPFKANTILNVNVPDVPVTKLQGIEITRLGTRFCAEPTVKQVDPRGQDIYWVGLPGAEQDAGPGTDFHAVRENKVSITPLELDWTHKESLEPLGEWAKDIAFLK